LLNYGMLIDNHMAATGGPRHGMAISTVRKGRDEARAGAKPKDVGRRRTRPVRRY
jgi:hypothetical protein